MSESNQTVRRDKWEREYVTLLSKVGDDPLIRIAAHVKNLDEYFLRWLGFCRLETDAPAQFLTDNGLFLVVEAASKVAGMDISRLTATEKMQVGQAWEAYQKSLAGLRQCPQTIKTEAEQSYLKFKTFAGVFETVSP